jgi:hypothetical protein
MASIQEEQPQMSTPNGAKASPNDTQGNRKGFPWIPVVTAIGIAAAALFILKRFSNDEDGQSLESALDASVLDDRLQTAG